MSYSDSHNQTSRPQRYCVGVDLGQARDFTAIAVVRRTAPPLKVTGGDLGAGIDDDGTAHYDLVWLERLALGTGYPAVVRHVLRMLDRRPLSRSTPLAIDKTGVGAAVVDLFNEAGLSPARITITAGETYTAPPPGSQEHRVPKQDIVGELCTLYQSRQFTVPSKLPLTPTLVRELETFRGKVNIATTHLSYEAWRESDHDDLVLAVAIACWYAEHAPSHPFGYLVRSDPSILAEAGVTPEEFEELWQ